MASPQYRVLLRNSTTFFAPGDVVVELQNAKNIGHSEYINDVGEAFFTLTQGDPKAPTVAALVDDVTHVQILRDGELVWAGWLGETDENETDVIFYAYSYAAAFFWLLSDWDQTWTGDSVSTIVFGIWTRVKTGISDSALRWVLQGSIETPATTSDGAIDLILPEYSANYKRALFILQEMAALSIGDTTNRVVFEITPAGVFHFWKDRGTTRTDQLWEYGANVIGYNRIRTPMDSRNVVYGVGSSPRDIVARRTDEDATVRAAKSRREEPIYYSWVRDEDELERVNKLRLKRALREDNQLVLSFAPGRVVPARATGASYALSDMVPVKIENGATSLNQDMLVTGQQVIVSRGQELVRAIVQESL